ncbi:MAG TPA: immunoglobulin domain-containing protein, partial [Bryobacteraceae bacterium]|nr:immunoglobulin domain-containing protein [Bryobacteraceae bacterium]
MNHRVRSEICRVATICGLLMAGNLAGQTTGPPEILNPPSNQSVFAGATATFTVNAAGMQPLSYQWFKPGSPTPIPIPNATGPTLVLPGVDEPDSGVYMVRVTNSLGSRTTSASLMVTRVDFGDAPSPYPTLIANGGAVHAIVQGVYLGAGVSFEPDGQPDPNASSDNFDDGVTFCTAMVRGSDCTMRVVASVNGYLDGWIDFNGNGVWEDPGERIFPSMPVMAGTNLLTFTVPASVPTTLTSTFARFRFSRNGGLAPGGFAPDGEVEDYRVGIYSTAADVCVNAVIFPQSIPPPNNGQCVLTVTNFGPSFAQNVVLSNNLPGVDILGVQGSAANACTVQGENIYCTLGDLQPGESRMIQFAFHPRQPSLITNNVIVRSDVFDPKPQNNRSTLVVRAAAPLLITSPPQNVRVLPGQMAKFYVVAQGFGPLTFQWFLNGAAFPNATNSVLTLVNVRNSAEVRVLVTDSLGSILSPPASLDVVYPPVILDGPRSTTNLPCGALAQFAVQADGGPGAVLQYQWRLNGVNIPGATNPVYEVTNSMRVDGGSYTVAVASDGGVTVSTPALRTCPDIPVFPPPDYFATRLSLAQVGDPYQGVIQISNTCIASAEPGEPNHAGEVGGASIWFQWTAPA